MWQAAKNLADKRAEALEGFKYIEETFDDIEFVFQVFPHDSDVRSASIDFVSVILETVEIVTKFYEKSIGRKMLAAYLKGDEYEIKVAESLQNIKDRSECLAHNTGDADILVSRQEAKMQSKIGRETLELTRTVELQTSSMENKLIIVQDIQAATENTMKRLLDEAQEIKKRNELLEQRLSAVTPTPTLSMPLTQPVGATTGWTTTPDTVWSLLHVPQEVEKIDVKTIEARQESLPVTDRGRTEQLVNL